jgi:peptidyl-prolyl cis-trans isomerase B (cyclophilin B)
VAGTKRERQLARAKYERQQAKRVSDHARRRQRNQWVAATVAAVAVVVGLVLVAKLTSPQATAATSPSPTPTSLVTATPTATGTTVLCLYRPNGKAAKKVSTPPTTAPRTPAAGTATITLNGRPVVVRLARAQAPCTVNSFTHLAEAGFFNGTPCHRLTLGSLAVLQCGDPSGTGSGGPGYQFNDENLTGATYAAGTVAMANSGPNTNGSQFFIVYANSSLPPSYTPFGTVVSGLAYVQAIAKQGVKGGGTDGPPAKPVTINRVVVGG